MFAVLLWWLLLQVIGAIALPIALKLLRFLPDRGYGFVRPVGLVLTGYLFWLLTSLGILQNTAACVAIVFLMVAGVSAWIWSKDGHATWDFLRSQWRMVLATELVFLLAFAAFALFRAYNPDIAATEKPMEFGFINAILRSRTFPPHDQWLSGFAISYYYFGYVLVAMLTRLSGLASDITFNLTVAMLFALTAGGAFSLVYNMVQAYRQGRQRAAQGAPNAAQARGILPSVLSGLLGAVLVPLMGNLEGIFELIRAHGGGSEGLWKWLDVKNLGPSEPSSAWYPTDGWWWWRASRVVHDRDVLGNSVEVIDEFPFFSYLLGDVHPHVLALPFVFLALALALNLLLSGRRREEPGIVPGRGLAARIHGWVRGVWPGGAFDVILWGVLLGSLGFLNTWDYPIYLAIFCLAYAIWRWGVRTSIVSWIVDVVYLGVLLLVLGLVLYAPFYISFSSQAEGIGLVADKTNWHQYVLMFGVFLFFVIGLLAALVVRYVRTPAPARRLPRLAQLVGGLAVVFLVIVVVKGWWTAAIATPLLGVAAVLLIWASQGPAADEPDAPNRRLPDSAVLALLLVLAGLALTLSVDFVFLRDSFGTRMNTVFKFYYQGWVLLGLASAFGAYFIVDSIVGARRRVGWIGGLGLGLWGLVALALVGTGLTYTVAAAFAKTEGFAGPPTLDGTRYVALYRPDDYAAIQWLRANAPENSTMVEAPGGSYTEYNWVSAHTGIPTLLGWGGHELQWRGNYDEPGRREPDIELIYQNTDVDLTRDVIAKYGIDYVYVGPLERSKYHVSQAVTRKLDSMFDRVYESGGVVVYGRLRQELPK